MNRLLPRLLHDGSSRCRLSRDDVLMLPLMRCRSVVQSSSAWELLPPELTVSSSDAAEAELHRLLCCRSPPSLAGSEEWPPASSLASLAELLLASLASASLASACCCIPQAVKVVLSKTVVLRYCKVAFWRLWLSLFIVFSMSTHATVGFDHEPMRPSWRVVGGVWGQHAEDRWGDVLGPWSHRPNRVNTGLHTGSH